MDAVAARPRPADPDRVCAAPAIVARWIDLGHCSPQRFHATYVELARLGSHAREPIVVCSTPRPHVSIGQCQNRERAVIADPGVPVVRRALGGGTVWVDEDQLCIVLIAPDRGVGDAEALRPGAVLAAVAGTLVDFGLPAHIREHDVWVRGRKVCGTGGATCAGARLFGFSFMRRFPCERFAQCVAVPCELTRAWLADALRLTMTDWMSEGRWPGRAALIETFRRHLHAHLGWRTRVSGLQRAERRAVRAPGEEEGEWIDAGAIATRTDLRLNARSILSTTRGAGCCRDTLVVDGRVVKVMVHDCAEH